MQLATYIKDLLYRYECVIVPGFGAFLTQNESARIDGASNTFYPPRKRLLFNRQLQTNDGILANYVASVENCSYELALQKIRNFTGRVSLELSEGTTVTLKNIGDFYLNKENSVQFTPSEKENFDTGSFGLASLVSPTVERIVVSEIIKKEPVVILHNKSSASINTDSRKLKHPYLKYAAAAVGVILVSTIGMKVYEGNVEKHNYTEKQKADALIENQIQEATFVIENPLPTLNLTINKNTGRYHIVAGAFREEKNAQKKINQLISQGYKAQMVGINRYGLRQVVYSSHNSRVEAKEMLRSIKQSVNKDAWLLTLDTNQ